MISPDLLIVGGAKDPNIAILAAAARSLGRAAVAVVFGDSNEPGFSWDLATRQLVVNEQAVKPRAAFLRQDVFSYADGMQPDRLDRAMAWHAAVTGSCVADSNVRMFNRNMDWRTASKPVMLELARAHGLAVPATVISNQESTVRGLQRQSPQIAKPVAGGAYCREVQELLCDSLWENGNAPVPAIIQEKLDYPEYRIYVIGDDLMAFELTSEEIDYRTDQHCAIKAVSPDVIPAGVRLGLGALARDVGVDFGAADFKSNMATGELCFLELNNQPMFAAHDRISDGALSRAIVRVLSPGN